MTITIIITITITHRKKRDQVTGDQPILAPAFDSLISLMAPVTKMEAALDKFLFSNKKKALNNYLMPSFYLKS